MRGRFLAFGAIAAVLLAAAGLALGTSQDARRRAFYLGGRLLEVPAPVDGSWVPLAGVAVLVRFPDQERVEPETFRCLLNGRDVTALLTVGQNGAAGAVFPLVEGSNQLRLAVFGRGWWGPWLYEDAVDLVVEVRRPLYLDLAAAPFAVPPA